MLVTSLSLIGISCPNQFSPVNGIVLERDETDGLLYPRFEQEALVLMLFETFDGIIIGTQDILLEDAQVSESMLAGYGFVNNSLVASLYRKAKNLGPAIPFTFNADGLKVKGFVRRFDISFRYSENLAEGVRNEIRRFLTQFGIGEIEEWESND